MSGNRDVRDLLLADYYVEAGANGSSSYHRVNTLNGQILSLSARGISVHFFDDKYHVYSIPYYRRTGLSNLLELSPKARD